MQTNAPLVSRLLSSDEPSIRYRVAVQVVGLDPESSLSNQLQADIRSSARVQQLLAERDEAGEIPCHPYTKWVGAHWVLSRLADIGYPAGDASLFPLREQVYRWLLGESHQKKIRSINGRVRRCASQEGNCLYALLALGLNDERSDELARRLVSWQWPDGGWNCDKNPDAIHSSYHESLIPLRGLAAHARETGNEASAEATARAAELFLKRHLFRRLADGTVIHADFVSLVYPPYWHYDVLSGLKVLAEAGFIGDPRCAPALDWLAARQLPAGGWPAEKKYYRLTDRKVSGRTRVNWGGAGKARMNEWVTVEALSVLKAAGRLALPVDAEAAFEQRVGPVS